MSEHRYISLGNGSRLVETLSAYGLVFSGQGYNWAETLRYNLAGADVTAIQAILTASNDLLAPVATDLLKVRPHGFAPLQWINAENLQVDLADAAISVPGIVLAQLATIMNLEAQGLDLAGATGLGHSQGVLGAELLEHLTEVEKVLAVAQLIGAAAAKVGRETGLIRTASETPMLRISGITEAQLTKALAEFSGALRPVIGVKNSYENFVVVGLPAQLLQLQQALGVQAQKSAQQVEAKKTGGSPFAPKFAWLDVQTAFHHPQLAAGVDQVVAWAEQVGLDTAWVRQLAEHVMTAQIDWPATVKQAVAGGAKWLLDVGPAAGVHPITSEVVAGLGVGTLNVAGEAGQQALFGPDGAAAHPLPVAWSAWAPKLVNVGGKVQLETAFTKLTGRSPFLLPGMTPTTVDPEIVAAAANAGHWAELAGGGQVTPEIFATHVAQLKKLLDPGVNVQFNSMFLDPYLWKLHIGGQRLVQRARANGAPFDGVVVTAGMPDVAEAAALVRSLQAQGLHYVSFKPGAVKHIRKVLQVAKEVSDVQVIMQVEGGLAGGHHSWEDLDQLLLATYAEIRATSNVVLCIGGGISSPEQAAEYLTGAWATRYGRPAMPVDGILLGTVAMATKEAKTSPSVKQLLAATPGYQSWVPAGGAAGGMASGRSQLGADIHEIDNSAAKAGRLLDEVAGDAEAVSQRKEEIVAAINRTAKPYFGDLAQFTYAGWLRRYVELTYTGFAADGVGDAWLDPSWAARLVTMIQRAEARLHPQDHGTFASAFGSTAALTAAVTTDPHAVLAQLEATYPQAATLTLHPAEVAWFPTLLRTPGKPAPFVPVIDGEVRRWWRSDSLWQSQHAKYAAGEVCIIPGPAAVAGITQVDEPVAALFSRYEQAAVAALQPAAPAERALTAVQQVVAAPGTRWADRDVPSIIHRIAPAAAWAYDAATDTAVEAESGAQVVATANTLVAQLRVPVIGSELVIDFTVSELGQTFRSPQVTGAAAVAAMEKLTTVAAGGTLPEVVAGVATWHTELSRSDIAAYQGVTSGFIAGNNDLAPDVLVGKAWPAIFSVVAAATTNPADGSEPLRVVEGMLSLVHLEHHLKLVGAAQQDLAGVLGEGVQLTVTASCDEVIDTDMGRIVIVRAQIAAAGQEIATLAERFAIRGRTGKATARTNTSVLPSVVDTPRSFRNRITVTAPSDMRPFALVSGDLNPIHTAPAAAAMAGLSSGVIVHGMWTSALAELAAAGAYQDDSATTKPGRVVEYTATMLAPVLPGQTLEITVERAGIDNRPGCAEIREVTVMVGENLVCKATAVMAAPVTFYAFPGQGIQHEGMGMAAYASSPAARAIWDRADQHTRTKLGFSILAIVRENPQTVVVAGETYHHPQGVLFLTQFTQVAMATLGVATIAQMREAEALNRRAFFAGHSVGEYNALAAYAGVLSLENVVEIVYLRGLTMHKLVERDAQGVSNYGLAALRPNKLGLSADNVAGFVADVAEKTGEFLEIVNYNIAGVQYAVAGTRAGLQALGARAEELAPGARGLIMIPGIDVPFHSTKLLGGVDDFRAHLDSLLPAEVDLEVLVDRYIPNLVARPFAVTKEFAQAILAVVDAPIIRELLANWDTEIVAPRRVARTLLVELLAWQFASPVRWIETQALAIDLGIDRFVEVGVGSAPTVANMFSQTLALPENTGVEIEVLNVERDRAIVYATDEVVVAAPAGVAPAADEGADAAPGEMPAAALAAAPATAAPVATSAERPADVPFTPAAATKMLIALWTKVRPDQMAPTDTIETLVEGVSSRRNQLLLDLGVEFGLGAIDGAANAELVDLSATVTKLAGNYTAFGPVLADAASDALRRITGPAGKRPGYVAERVTGTWQLGPGWADHVVAAVVMGSREGASLRGGELASLPLPVKTAADLDALIDAAVQQVGADHGVSVTLPAAGGAAGGVVDAAALGSFAEQVTGKAGVLAETARTILANLGLSHIPQTADLADEASDAKIFEIIAAELGSNWPRLVARSFDPQRAVLLDDRWASAREDVARIALGQQELGDPARFTGTGAAVAAAAQYWASRGVAGMEAVAAAAQSTSVLPYAQDVAVVTGASPHSIAAAVVGQLLAGGATVVATTSSLDEGRLSFYKQLYREHARGGAALWVVPANLMSFADTDAVIEWVGSQQTATVNGATKLVKPALVPTILFPFAAPRVSGFVSDAGPTQEQQMRLLLWSVERLIGGLTRIGADTHVANRLHVVLPGSPNRGRFGGDGAYGEAKAALDALVTKWHAEPAWAERTSLVHCLIGWVRGTGLMGGNDPLVAAVEAAGVTTFSTEEMAANLVANLTPAVRRQAAAGPVVADYTGGLGEANVNLAELAREAAANAEAALEAAAAEQAAQLAALPNVAQPVPEVTPEFANVSASLEDMVVIVGAAELGPYGSSRTRFEAELTGDLSAAGVIELAWSMKLISWNADGKEPGWQDAEGNPLAEANIYAKYHDQVLARVGVRRYHDDFHMMDNLAPELTTIFLDKDLEFVVSDKETARSFVDSEPDTTQAYFNADTEEWVVVRKAGSAIRVPRRMAMSRFIGGQIPEGFDPQVYGIPADMADNLDRVALWNLVCTVDAFLSSGFSPAELLASVHPTRVSDTQGTGLGGMESMRSLYVDALLAEPRANDILQEALPNVVAAHVMQSYVGGYGQMVHPVAACATAAVSVEEGVDKIHLGKADFVVAGGIDDLSIEGITGFGDMAATADSGALLAKGISERFVSRPNDRRRGGFVESAGGGAILLARGTLAAELGLPVLGVVAYAQSFADGAHTSIPAPGLGALAAAQGGSQSRLARALASLDVSADEIALLSKHDTSTTANDPNESDLHERIAAALGRSSGNPLYVISQKSLTGHAKGGAAAFQIIGLTQVLRSGLVPANRSLDCVDPVLAQHEHLVWLREPLDLSARPAKAGFVTSLGFGHVSALVAIVHPAAFTAALAQQQGAATAATWQQAAAARAAAGLSRIQAAIYGGPALYERPVERNLGVTGVAAKQLEAQVLLDPQARLVDGAYRLS